MQLSAGDKLGPTRSLRPSAAGAVYKAWDQRLTRFVAIKVSQAAFSQRFEREARAVAALNHPNICQLYDVGENYLVMEFVDGSPVSSPASTLELLDQAAQIADGALGWCQRLSPSRGHGIKVKPNMPAS
jgi:eukaryotic-like serine/threonine-protein kinase